MYTLTTLDLEGYQIGEQGAHNLADALLNDVVILTLVTLLMSILIFKRRHSIH